MDAAKCLPMNRTAVSTSVRLAKSVLVVLVLAGARLYAAVPATQPTTQPVVLLVTQGNSFLERTVKNLGCAQCVIVNPDEFERRNIPAALVVFDGYRPKRLPLKSDLLFFGATPPSDDLVVGHIKNQQVQAWSRTDPLLTGLAMDKLFAATTLRLKPGPGWEILASGEDSPLLLRRKTSSGTTIVVGFVITESNWPLQASFPAFISHALCASAVARSGDAPRQ